MLIIIICWKLCFCLRSMTTFSTNTTRATITPCDFFILKQETKYLRVSYIIRVKYPFRHCVLQKRR